MVKILVFDTETTDVPPEITGKTWKEREKKEKELLSFTDYKKKKSVWSTYINVWPSIIQLSYILYDTENPSNAKIFNKYIDIPEEIKITEESIAVHHITREKIAAAADVNRAKIYDALDEFMEDVNIADVVVGHNVQFDRKMIIAELTRVSKTHKLPQINKMMDDSNFVCTMEKTKPVCNLKRKYETIDKKTGDIKVFYKIKPPKLLEAYKHYFGYEPAGEALHDALIDVVVCLRVYCMSLDDGFDVCGTNPIITDYIKQISPPGYICESKEITVVNQNITSDKSKTKTRRKKEILVEPTEPKKSTITTRARRSNRAIKRSSSFSEKPKLSTIAEVEVEEEKDISHKKSISQKSMSQKSETPVKSSKVKSKSVKPKSVKPKSVKSKRKSKNEMSDFIVEDKKSVWN